MPLYNWDPKFELGVPSIDEQHRRIFDLANLLHAAGCREDSDALVETALLEMSTYVDEHFGDEEAFMQGIGYPAFEEHRVIHEEMRRKVADLHRQFRAGDVRGPEVHFLVVSWLMQHITGVDARIAEYAEGRDAA